MKSSFNKIKFPVFFPTINTNAETWFWKHGIKSDGVLISYDVLIEDSRFQNTKKSIKNLLGFDGAVIIDSGGFGISKEEDPIAVYTKQKALNADIGILLDKVILPSQSVAMQKIFMEIVLKNAENIFKRNNNKIRLMAVVQGADDKQQRYCAEELKKLGYTIYGIPLSNFSKNRKYEEAVKKFLNIKNVLGDSVIFHGLGCGSRTLIAVFSHLGISIFDSSNYYKAAMFGEAIKDITFCALGKSINKKECASCLHKQSQPKTYEEKIFYNLVEIQKEITRSRCAIEEGKMKEYLPVRLGKTVYNKLEKYLTISSPSPS